MDYRKASLAQLYYISRYTEWAPEAKKELVRRIDWRIRQDDPIYCLWRACSSRKAACNYNQWKSKNV